MIIFHWIFYFWFPFLLEQTEDMNSTMTFDINPNENIERNELDIKRVIVRTDRIEKIVGITRYLNYSLDVA